MVKCTLLLTVILAFSIACSLASPRKHRKPKHGRHGKHGGKHGGKHAGKHVHAHGKHAHGKEERYKKGGDCKQTERGVPCTIPFKYKGVSYTECTRIDEPRPWCATSVRSNGEYRTYQYCSNLCALPVDGALSPWTQWGICSAPCGPGAQQRTRVCDPAKRGGKPCEDERFQTRNCQVKPCPVDGKLTEWGSWGACSEDCGVGIFTRTRSCVPEEFGGRPCNGPLTDTQPCLVKQCPVDAKLGSWTSFSACSANCGPGTHFRTRSCTPPQFGGRACPHYFDKEKKVVPGELETTPCEIKECPVDGINGP